MHRSIPISSEIPVFRGLGFNSKAEFDAFVNTLKLKGMYHSTNLNRSQQVEILLKEFHDTQNTELF